jgi:hypothetical protein
LESLVNLSFLANFSNFTLIKNENFQKTLFTTVQKLPLSTPPKKKRWNLGVGVKGNWYFGNLEYLGILVIYIYIYIYIIFFIYFYFYENG